ncbi:cupin domain-containing protein [Phormidesmis sp. 146-12]
MTELNSSNLNDVPNEIVTVRPTIETMTRQGLPYFIGISGATAGTEGLSLSLVEIPPGGIGQPHIHQGFETAIYILKGRVEARYGDRLQHSVIHEAGDFMFVPPGVPHQPRNLSETESVQAIVARNNAYETEDGIPYTPPSD